MQVLIHFRGAMARLAAGETRTIEVRNPAALADAVQILTEDPAIAGHLALCTYTVDGTIVGASYQLREGCILSVGLPESRIDPG